MMFLAHTIRQASSICKKSKSYWLCLGRTAEILMYEVWCKWVKTQEYQHLSQSLTVTGSFDL